MKPPDESSAGVEHGISALWLGAGEARGVPVGGVQVVHEEDCMGRKLFSIPLCKAGSYWMDHIEATIYLWTLLNMLAKTKPKDVALGSSEGMRQKAREMLH